MIKFDHKVIYEGSASKIEQGSFIANVIEGLYQAQHGLNQEGK